MAWKDVSNFAESKVMRQYAEGEGVIPGVRGYRRTGGGAERSAARAKGEIDFVYGPACSPYNPPWFSIVSLLAVKPKVADG